MSTTTTNRLTIKDGPRAEIIWTAAQHAYSPDVKVTVTFTLDRGLPQPGGEVMWQIIRPVIMGVSHEDGSGQSFIIEGYLDGRHFTGYYDARRRQGFIDVTR